MVLIRRLFFLDRSIKDGGHQAGPRSILSDPLGSAADLLVLPSQTAPTLKIKAFDSLSNYFWRAEPTKASVSAGSGQRRAKSDF